MRVEGKKTLREPRLPEELGDLRTAVFDFL
jgi:hypothetical protein